LLSPSSGSWFSICVINTCTCASHIACAVNLAAAARAKCCRLGFAAVSFTCCSSIPATL
jgi:hypothetical protein